MPNIKRVKGDRFILCRWHPKFGPMIEEQSDNNSLEWLLGQIPRFLNTNEDERLSVCQVGHWTYDEDNDPTDWTPQDITTFYEIDHYSDPTEEDAAKEDANVT